MNPTNATLLDSTKTGELMQVNLGEIKGQVADQIRAFLLNMMPQAAFDRVIADAWEKLTKPRLPEKDQWGHSRGEAKPSELEEMVTGEMRTIMLARVREWSSDWAKRESASVDGVLRTSLDQLATACAQTHLTTIGREILERAMSSMSDMKLCDRCQRFGRPNSNCVCGNHIKW